MDSIALSDRQDCSEFKTTGNHCYFRSHDNYSQIINKGKEPVESRNRSRLQLGPGLSWKTMYFFVRCGDFVCVGDGYYLDHVLLGTCFELYPIRRAINHQLHLLTYLFSLFFFSLLT